MITPVIGHPTCNLGLQQRLRDAEADAVVRSVGRAGKGAARRIPLRLFSGLRRRMPPVIPAAALRPAGEDVWEALRF